MSTAIVNKTRWEKPVPGVRCHSILLSGGYAYSSMCGGEVSGSSSPSVGRRRGWFAGFSSRGLRYGRRWSIDVDGAVGVSGLMTSSVPMSIYLNLQLFTVYIDSFVNILGKILARGRPGVWAAWLMPGWLRKHQPGITGLY